ncbi:Sensor protein BasS [Marinomonas spartinae]|uniref:histidine kinase n=1 Tax=Marinomonas spartinae TaxID=1792290 RepID=A0A1A8TDY0_9GAMM|nr:HAMP domain-containing sensor histidine kinase [Marinomonas spartinae]SBS30240.1 Sensor protein BasS [Marinomonas spartinae]SBS36839.1 Sensor protein BasS [Marinomonas spartinae]
MKRIKSAKQLTFTYFSIVAFAIITFHFTMFDTMLESMETIYAQNRMHKDLNTAIHLLQGTHLTHVAIPPFSDAYVGEKSLPPWVVLEPDVSDDKPYHLAPSSDTDLEYFSMKKRVMLNGKMQNIYLIHYDEIYEESESQMFKTQTTQTIMSVLLLVISLWVVMRISARLTNPLARLSQELEGRNAQDSTPIPVPDGAATREIHQLVSQLNSYQNQIQALLHRERAFNRYASHELRTPLMVMKGALTLLGKSDSKVFLERQRVRMSSACQEMEDYITTLLSLTREDDIDAMLLREVDDNELQAIVRAHTEYNSGKPVEVVQHRHGAVKTKLPMPTLHILIGNLVKNAIACTEQGQIDLIMSDQEIKVVDPGCGLQGKPSGESYGLGLMIVRDICQKYHCEFSLKDNEVQGCTAKVIFPE